MDCVHRQCFWKYSWAHVLISITVAFLYVMQCCLSARRSRASQYGFPALTLTHRDCSRFSDLWMILCTVDDDNFKLFAIFLWETPFLILLHYFSPQHWGNWWSSSHLDFWEDTATLRGSFIPIMLPIDLIVANWSSSCSLYVHLTFRPLIATCPNFFGMCSSHEIQNEPIFGMTFQNVSLSTFDMLSIFYCE